MFKIQGSIPDQRFHGVEMPLIVNDEQKALRMLGGESAVAQALKSDPPQPLEMHFRRAPHSHPAFGDLSHPVGLLLRVGQRGDATILGSFQNMYQFKGMYFVLFFPFFLFGLHLKE